MPTSEPRFCSVRCSNAIAPKYSGVAATDRSIGADDTERAELAGIVNHQVVGFGLVALAEVCSGGPSSADILGARLGR